MDGGREGMDRVHMGAVYSRDGDSVKGANKTAFLSYANCYTFTWTGML